MGSKPIYGFETHIYREVSELVLSRVRRGDYFADMHVDFGDIERYLRENIYPDGINDKGKKANFQESMQAIQYHQWSVYV